MGVFRNLLISLILTDNGWLIPYTKRQRQRQRQTDRQTERQRERERERERGLKSTCFEGVA